MTVFRNRDCVAGSGMRQQLLADRLLERLSYEGVIIDHLGN
jgi:hypothetical protein